jgi:hypothetical protein
MRKAWHFTRRSIPLMHRRQAVELLMERVQASLDPLPVAQGILRLSHVLFAHGPRDEDRRDRGRDDRQERIPLEHDESRENLPTRFVGVTSP